jgi:lysophospholipase L1-like esterase
MTQTPGNFRLRKLSVRRLWIGLGLALASICLTLAFLELAVRLLPPPYDLNAGYPFTCSNTLGWTGTPDFQGVIEYPEFRQEVRFNSLGMHDTDHAPAKPAGTFRILMLGDSFVQAVQVAEAATTHQVLEDDLNQAAKAEARHFEVISGGVVNWGTNQQLIYYREEGRRFQPDLVLLMFYLGNDLQDNLPGNVLTIKGFNCYAPYFAVCDGRLDPAPLAYAPAVSRSPGDCAPAWRLLTNTMGWLYQHSRLYQQLEPLIVSRQPRRIFGQAYPQPFSALYLPNDEVELAQAWQVTLATVAQLRQEVTADKVRLAVAIISPEILIRLALLSPAEQQIFLRDNPKFAAARFGQPNERLAAFLKDQGIPFIDLMAPLVAYQAAHGVPLYFQREGGHWTAEGNRVVAGILADWLTQNGLLSE